MSSIVVIGGLGVLVAFVVLISLHSCLSEINAFLTVENNVNVCLSVTSYSLGNGRWRQIVKFTFFQSD